jgi:YfiH family protein
VIERHTEYCEYYLFEHLAHAPNLTHAVFTRRRGFSATPFGGLNASAVTGDDPAVVRRNKAAIVAALGMPLIGAKPVHGANTLVIERDMVERAQRMPGVWPEPLQAQLRTREADAMVTDAPGIALCWAFGDCAPILLYDPRHRAIAMVHAGWRGTAQAVAVWAIQTMVERYGTRPAELLAGIGPSIGACCYEVNEQVRETFAREPLAWESARFVEQPGAGDGGDTALFLDVRGSNYGQLRAAGLRPEHIEYSDFCTGCRTDLFYSHRREPWPSGRFAVAIGLGDETV